ncbi:hypothetical protein OS493_013483 [Desmophyllum pertusum]|uniref:Crk-like protein n=1 Tax=Desmophyllum pertusum TaxID=174260 RepID=A0A9X0D9U3_9CNID|nr:hypothetical protein OS493_013483 [Desmophyllum pertusum]
MSRSNPNQLSCYLGRVSRPTTEKYLQGRRPGTYLIRDSSSIPGDFVLAVSESGKVSHYIINSKGSHYQIGENTFPDLSSIIDFYKKHFLDSTSLIEPLFRVQAQYPFTAKDAEDLSFNRGDTLVIVEQNEEKWWTAMDEQGNKGLIPEPYVKKLVDLQQQTATPPQPIVSPQSAIDQRRSMPPPVATVQDNSNSRRTSVPPNMRPNQSPADTGGTLYVRATRKHLMPYDDTTLAFEKGDLIKVLRKNDNGKWFGQKDDRTGYFQFNYVEIIPANECPD